MRRSSGLVSFLILHLAFSGAQAADKEMPLLKSATESGKRSASEATLYEQSIRATKQNIARETLDVFYRDALDDYNDRRYDEALELLDKIISVDPRYENVQTLRASILKLQADRERQDLDKIAADAMSKGNKAFQSKQPILAISFWKKALEANPNHAAAKKRIDEVNHNLAQKQFEIGYIHYHHGEFEEATEAWQNAVALDPSYKQRGLLLLMSRVEQNMRKDQVARLATQSYAQFEAKEYEAALRSYQELLRLDPRNDEARRMSAKIQFMLGQAAFKAAQGRREHRQYNEAIESYQASIRYNYEIPSSQNGIKDVEALLKKQREPKRAKPPKPAVVQSTTTAPAAVASPPQPPAPPADPAQALNHYRQGLGAIKSGDYHRATSELQIAYQLDPSNERIYVALQRAQQAWKAVQESPAPAGEQQP